MPLRLERLESHHRPFNECPYRAAFGNGGDAMTEAKPLSAEELRQFGEHMQAIVYSQRHHHRDHMSRAYLAKWEWEHITSLQAENAALVETGNKLAMLMPLHVPEVITLMHKEVVERWAKLRSNPTSAGAALLKRLEDAEKQVAHDAAWIAVAVQSHKDIDAYLLSKFPELEVPYGMPVDGIRRTVEHCVAEARAEVERLRQNQRTPHTVEVCEGCWDETGEAICENCGQEDCPLRSQEKK